jgi:PilZ domain
LANASNPANRRRSERVVLQMKVTVIADDVQRKPRQEEALTQVVNAHGGLLKLKMDVHVGQPMRLVNPQNKVEQNCRVVRVDETGTEFFSVAFEFDHPNPKFWPVVFPPSDWEAPRA